MVHTYSLTITQVKYKLNFEREFGLVRAIISTVNRVIQTALNMYCIQPLNFNQSQFT